LAQALVGPAPVEVGDVLGQDPLQVPLAEDQDMIDALAADAPEEALADGVRARRPNRRQDHVDAATGRDPCEGGAVLGVVVVDQEARPRPLRRRLAELLGDPRVAGRSGDAHVHHAS
jgi:hypothetical protein